MEMKVETISIETIKPSSATPSNLNLFKLCLLDQLSPPFYIPIILFYSPNSNHHNPTSLLHNLKSSLSETLSSFYPFSGTLKPGNTQVECDDRGALFIVARARMLLSEVTSNPDSPGLENFLPFPPYRLMSSEEEVMILGVKVSFFQCGGVAVGVCVSHKIADGCSLAQFLVSWAQAGLGIGSGRAWPCLDASVIFPPRDVDFQMPGSTFSTEKLVTKRFHFGPNGIARLRAVFSGSCCPNLTRVEAITALIWKTALEAARARWRGSGSGSGSGSYPPSAATHLVNIRARAAPPLPEKILGNLWQSVVAPLKDPEEEGPQLQDLLVLLQNSIKSVNGDSINELRGDNGLAKALESVMAARRLGSDGGGGVEIYRFSSWTRFPLYEVDFGWGKPVWVCSASSPMKNVILLMGRGSEDEGIEAWVTLGEADMAEFEANDELLQFMMPPK